MRVWCCIAAVGLLALFLAGCGDGTGSGTTEERPATTDERHPDRGPPTSLEVTLAGEKGPESAGLVMAADEGYFEDENLEVAVLTPASPLSAVEYVIGEVDDIGVTHQPELMLARREGAPIEIIGSLIPEPTAAMIWPQKSKIRGIADLEGKTIAIQGLPYQRLLLDRILERAGLSPGDVRIREVEYNLVPSLLHGRADAIFGGSANIEGVELESAGLDPVITPVSRLGVPSYEELVLFARSDYVKRNPRVIRGFMRALRRGNAAAIEDPEAAAYVIDTDPETVVGTGLKEMEAELELTLPLLSENGSTGSGHTDRLGDWLRE